MKKIILFVFLLGGCGLSVVASSIDDGVAQAMNEYYEQVYARDFTPPTESEKHFSRISVPNLEQFNNDTQDMALVYRMLLEKILYRQRYKNKKTIRSVHDVGGLLRGYNRSSIDDRVAAIRYIFATRAFLAAKEAGFPSPEKLKGAIAFPDDMSSLGRELFFAICAEIGMKGLRVLDDRGRVFRVYWQEEDRILEWSLHNNELEKELQVLWQRLSQVSNLL